MKKYLVLVVMMAVASVSYSDIIWSTADLVAGGIPGISAASAGWLVQLFSDVSDDTALGSVTFGQDGTPTGTGNSSDDVLLASYTSSMIVDGRSGAVYFSEAYDPYVALYGLNLYTVILDDTSWANASESFVLDNATYSVTGSGLEVYTAPANNPGEHSWSPIPEPTTLAFLFLGTAALFLQRRRIQA